MNNAQQLDIAEEMSKPEDKQKLSKMKHRAEKGGLKIIKTTLASY